MTEWLPLLVSFTTLLLVGVMSPGPAFFVTTHSALTFSRKEAFASVLGIATGNLIFASLSVLGFSALSQNSSLMKVIHIFGGCYLLYLAFKLSTAQPVQAHAVSDQGDQSCGFLSGCMVQLSNPKAFLFISSAVSFAVQKNHEPHFYFLVAMVTFLVSAGWYGFICSVVSLRFFREALRPKLHWFCRCSALVILYMAYRMFLQVFAS
ncbi:LysE family translocator [Photobacterium sp. 2_MG-2023]|uniref:LysE family translocator n=1 Tax=Photobacterium sp. 2_MG-2023 TaxID=3062663 RepID=UPI0026E2B969|nr:LysE family translocator [Photobacterium sp. 2_MG-2023]MDO6583110.1 LysE family translocator [Photobacterium sp. 2_MG-2023]